MADAIDPHFEHAAGSACELHPSQHRRHLAAQRRWPNRPSTRRPLPPQLPQPRKNIPLSRNPNTPGESDCSFSRSRPGSSMAFTP